MKVKTRRTKNKERIFRWNRISCYDRCRTYMCCKVQCKGSCRLHCGRVQNERRNLQECTYAGGHLISPTVKTSLYSVGIEQSYLTSEDKGDSPKDESFKTPTADGKSLLVDLEFSYKFDQSRVTDVFTQFKGQSGESVKKHLY